MSRASTGHIRKLPSGRWQARFTYPDGVRRPAPTTFQTKTGRERLAGAAERRRIPRSVVADQGQPCPSPSPTTRSAGSPTGEVKGQPLADRTQ